MDLNPAALITHSDTLPTELSGAPKPPDITSLVEESHQLNLTEHVGPVILAVQGTNCIKSWHSMPGRGQEGMNYVRPGVKSIAARGFVEVGCGLLVLVL